MMAWLIGGIVTLFLGLIAKSLAEYGKEQPPTAADCVARMRAINEAYTSEKAGPAYRPAPPGLDYYGEYRRLLGGGSSGPGPSSTRPRDLRRLLRG